VISPPRAGFFVPIRTTRDIAYIVYLEKKLFLFFSTKTTNKVIEVIEKWKKPMDTRAGGRDECDEKVIEIV